jgi:adenine/guanine/hypoxanthine permease
VVSVIGCLMGNPFIDAVYIGHPGWKAMGGRIGYSAATSVMVILLAWFGIISVMVALIPVVSVSYFAVSLILVSCAKFATMTAKATAETADHAPAGLPEPAA